ncbi:uncharacterized protein LOC120529912 [Polypterus senegalus]|uniref:uncharacterized protein LOC120529912 n=1 Tax=Polypterus senegalus TaxID=55291 RepID=UPI001966147D|nr:uncharacterized protein LOC120529912 [Polypterus senegalus]
MRTSSKSDVMILGHSRLGTGCYLKAEEYLGILFTTEGQREQEIDRYQSTLDLRNALTEEERKKILHRNETPENKMEMLKMVFEKKADKKRSGIDRSIFSHFQRSKSMEHLPIRKADAGVNICALRAVFEPKGSPIKRFHPKYFHLPGKSAAKHEVTFATPWHIAASTYEKPEKYTSGRGGKVKEQLKHRKEERSESRTSVPGVQVQFSGVTEHSC